MSPAAAATPSNAPQIYYINIPPDARSWSIRESDMPSEPTRSESSGEAIPGGARVGGPRVGTRSSQRAGRTYQVHVRVSKVIDAAAKLGIVNLSHQQELAREELKQRHVVALEKERATVALQSLADRISLIFWRLLVPTILFVLSPLVLSTLFMA